jgi:hypothetical protein
MAYDDPKLPRAVLRGDQLFVGKDKDPDERDPGYRVALEVTELGLVGGFEPKDMTDDASPKVPVRPSLSGRAKIEGKDRFAVAGTEVGKDAPIAFQLRPVPVNETRFLWRGTLAYSPHDWEYDRDETYWISAHVPPDDFEDIVAAVRSGRVERLRVVLILSMWTKQKSSGFMHGPEDDVQLRAADRQG